MKTAEKTLIERIEDIINLVPGMTTREIADYLEAGYGSVRTLTSRLKNEGKVNNRMDGTWYSGAWYDVVGFETTPTVKPRSPWWRRFGWRWSLALLPVLSYLVGRYA